MKLEADPRLPLLTAPGYDGALSKRLYELFRRIAQQVNGLTDGSVAASTAATSAPTAGNYYQGDFVRNAQPVESGAVGSKYVVMGWMCTASGTPGTWKQCRALTGN